MKVIVYLIMVLLVSSFALGATIGGYVYSYDLEKQSKAVVTIDTEPKQTMVTDDGSYTFSVGKGSYNVTAQYREDGELISYVVEEVHIVEDGSYSLDLILFPSLVEEEELMEQIDDSEPELEQDYTLFYVLGGIGLVLLVVVVFLVWYVHKKNSRRDLILERDISDDVLAFVKKEGGRVTQKEIRNNFPSSEAKISLVITELEHKGKVERIKKGRANIVVLKK